jgi:hypothetical protein
MSRRTAREQTWRLETAIVRFTPKADIPQRRLDVRFVPQAEVILIR